MHKGFKCLDVASGHIYVSRDVIFDEIVYPFSTLHSNAGARLRSEIIGLPSTLLNPGFGGSTIADNVPNILPEQTDVLHELCSETQEENPSPDTSNNVTRGSVGTEADTPVQHGAQDS